jgi:hypothetical protein
MMTPTKGPRMAVSPADGPLAASPRLTI